MKKITTTVLVVLLLLSCVGVASAISERLAMVQPTVDFASNTVECSVRISADTGDSISATIALYEGTTCIKTWYKTGTSYLYFYQEVPAMIGYKYTLTVDATIDGIKQPTYTATGTYVP